jgi:hypothetical protein
LSTENESPVAAQQPAHTRVSDAPLPAHEVMRKQFVEPEVSAPLNVLEATTFFQAATSGGTN